MDRPSASKKAKVEASETLMKETMMERNRRGKMSSFYSDLQTMVPTLPAKATRTTIIDGTISYIQELEKTVKELEARKKVQFSAHFSLQTLKTSSIDTTVTGSTVFFSIRSAARPGLVSSIAHVFEQHGAEVLGTSVVREQGSGEMRMMVTAVINREGEGDEFQVLITKIKSDLLKCL